MQNYKDHRISPTPPVIAYLQTDTVQVTKQLSLQILSEETGVPVEVLAFLNPIYRRGIVPKSENPLSVRLPAASVEHFLKKENLMYDRMPSKPDFHEILANSGSTVNKVKVVHIVQYGEYLHKIAIRYGCTIDDINVWNPNLSTELAIGQQLILWLDVQTYNKLFLEQNSLIK